MSTMLLCHANALQDGRDPVPRHLMGMAAKHASQVARAEKLKRPGPLWAKRPHCMPIESREHQVKAVRYVERHRQRDGAALWTMWKGLLPLVEQ